MARGDHLDSVFSSKLGPAVPKFIHIIVSSVYLSEGTIIRRSLLLVRLNQLFCWLSSERPSEQSCHIRLFQYLNTWFRLVCYHKRYNLYVRFASDLKFRWMEWPHALFVLWHLLFRRYLWFKADQRLATLHSQTFDWCAARGQTFDHRLLLIILQCIKFLEIKSV